jgi:hypothetical protein
MDGERFDRLTRTMAEGLASRRAVVGALIGGAVALVGGGRPGGVEAGCGSCRRRTRGRCVKRRNDAACEGDGRCFNGRCNPRPTCAPTGTPCGSQFEGCCAGTVGCLFGTGCIETGPGQPCYGDGECVSNLRCVGYVCRA